MLFAAEDLDELLHGGDAFIGDDTAGDLIATSVEVTSRGADQTEAHCPKVCNVVSAIVGRIGSGVKDLHTVKQLGLDDIECVAEGMRLNDEHIVLDCKGAEAVELHLVNLGMIIEEFLGHAEHEIIVVASLKAHLNAEKNVEAVACIFLCTAVARQVVVDLLLPGCTCIVDDVVAEMIRNDKRGIACCDISVNDLLRLQLGARADLCGVCVKLCSELHFPSLPII